MSDEPLIEELVISDSFCNYCFRNNTADMLYWERYIAANPAQKEKIREARQIVLGIRMALQQVNPDRKPVTLYAVRKDDQSGRQPGIKKKVWLAAASVIFLIGIAAYSLFITNSGTSTEVAKAVALPNDVNAPETQKALITLSNGQTVYLDSAAKGTLALQGNVRVIKKANGEIAYQIEATESSQEPQFNTLVNPRGSQVVTITLADGSRVWLNAGSSLTYPVAFTKKERQVSVSGEGYFEVAHDAAKPFIVQKNGINIQVLGTRFNVNAYEDDGDIKVTLLQGAVKIQKGRRSALLAPGEQAQIAEQIKVVDGVDTDAVMAWKNGYFHFYKASLQDVLKQLSYWYDVEIEYKEKVEPIQFVGEMERNLSLMQVLKILRKNGVNFQVEGKKLVVR